MVVVLHLSLAFDTNVVSAKTMISVKSVRSVPGMNIHLLRFLIQTMLQALLELYLKKINLTLNSKKLSNLLNSAKDLIVIGDNSSEEEEEEEDAIEVLVVQDRIGKMLQTIG